MTDTLVGGRLPTHPRLAGKFILQQTQGIIGRPVVMDADLKVFAILIKGAADGLGNKPAGIIGRDINGNLRNLEPRA